MHFDIIQLLKRFLEPAGNNSQTFAKIVAEQMSTVMEYAPCASLKSTLIFIPYGNQWLHKTIGKIHSKLKLLNLHLKIFSKNVETLNFLCNPC